LSARLTLDHVGVAVPDLAQAHSAYTKLGFNLTALSIHSGQPSADGKVQSLGSGNHCAMFCQGYMELIGVVDPNRPSSVGPFLKTRHGGFITALACDDVNAAYEFAVKDFPTTQKPVALERMVDDPAGGSAKAEFRNVLMGAGFPETRLLIIQHLTREVIWREHEMTHPNGVVALSGAQFLVADVDEAAGCYGRLTGVAPQATSYGAVLTLNGQTMQFFAAGKDGAPQAHVPSMFGAVFGVADIGKTADLLTGNGVDFTEDADGALHLSPAQAGGFALTFTTADKSQS